MKFNKLATSLITAFAVPAASAGVITITIDDFNVAAAPSPLSANWTTPGGGSWTWTSVTPGSAAALVQSYVSGGNFVINTPNESNFAGSLTYATTVAYAGIGGTNGKLVFTAVNSDNPGNSINGVSIPDNSGLPATLSTAYASGGAVALNFLGSPVKAWDVSIDMIGVSFDCGSVNSGAYASMSDFLSALRQNANGSCVPVPGSLALLGVGGLAAALVARRRQAK